MKEEIDPILKNRILAGNSNLKSDLEADKLHSIDEAFSLNTYHPLSDGRITRSGRYAHFCYEWDDLLIDENDPEFETCLCFSGDPTALKIKNEWWEKRRKVMKWEETKAIVLQVVLVAVALSLLYWIVVKVD